MSMVWVLMGVNMQLFVVNPKAFSEFNDILNRMLLSSVVL